MKKEGEHFADIQVYPVRRACEVIGIELFFQSVHGPDKIIVAGGITGKIKGASSEQGKRRQAVDFLQGIRKLHDILYARASVDKVFGHIFGSGSSAQLLMKFMDVLCKGREIGSCQQDISSSVGIIKCRIAKVCADVLQKLVQAQMICCHVKCRAVL